MQDPQTYRDSENSPEYVFLLPWMIRGGADLGALHFVNTLADVFQKSVAVITTESIDSPWANRLSEKVTFFELGLKVGQVMNFDRAVIKTLNSIISELNPRVVHIMNSRHGWMWLQLFHNSNAPTVYASLYADEITRDNLVSGYPQWFLERNWQKITQIVSDNNYFPKQWSTRYKIPISRFSSVHFPVEKVKERDHPNHRKLEPIINEKRFAILWASRISRLKRPELLIDIATSMPEADFFVYGAPDAEIIQSGLMNKINSISNISICGPFDSISEILQLNPDCFLYTSKIDGTPNILLEISQIPIPIVTPTVGGIVDLLPENWPWTIPNQESGDPGAYVKLLKKLLGSIESARDDAEFLKTHIENKHSQRSFQNDLHNIPNYVNVTT